MSARGSMRTGARLCALAAAPVERLPAVSPIDGPFWTLFVPAALFAVAFVATWLLYRRFSRAGG